MKKILLLAALAAGVAIASTYPQRYKWQMATCPAGTGYDESYVAQCAAAQVCSAGTCTTAAPATTATQGMSLLQLKAFRLSICAASGQTLSGAGTMSAYVYQSGEGRWLPDPGLNQTVTATTRCQAFPDFQVGGSFDRVQFVATGVTVSGGLTLDVLLDGQIDQSSTYY